MFQLLIVDDEENIADGLAEVCSASGLPLKQPFVAYSATEALTLCRDNPIDLILTDIRMPGMSGLDLLDAIKDIREQVKVIFLTGYAEFHYAQRALSGHAFAYLLKPA